MTRLDEDTLQAFRDELQKTAGFADLVARAAPTLKNIGSLGGVGALVGGVGGGTLGFVKDYRDARKAGATRGTAALQGLMGAGSGARKGAIAGTAIGATGGLLARGDMSGLGQRNGLLGVASRFGQRQVHGLTGMLSPAELNAVRGGSWDAQQAVQRAGEALRNPPPQGFLTNAANFVRGRSPEAAQLAQGASLAKQYRSADAALAATRAITGEGPGAMNLTSLPGIASAVKNQGVGRVLGSGLGHQLAGAGALGAAATVAPALYGTVQEARSQDAPDAAGRTKGERLGSNLAQTAGGVVTGVLPMGAREALQGALGRAGGFVGRTVDRVRGARPAGAPGMTPTTLEPAESQQVPSERVMSPAAAGQQPDIGL